MRGEYSFIQSLKLFLLELPPRARRILLAVFHPHFKNVNYLRVRGEYFLSFAFHGQCRELPPRARRIRGVRGLFPRGFGTTSACAENTSPIFAAKSAIWNYLRVRGEYHTGIMPAHDAWELPPRARRIRGAGFGPFDT